MRRRILPCRVISHNPQSAERIPCEKCRAASSRQWAAVRAGLRAGGSRPPARSPRRSACPPRR
ncbi:hypothetical protein KPaMU14_11225 [Kocuria palustris]|nr:hypothetical protein KPaMU14_11225 [Kocuria palustris]